LDEEALNQSIRKFLKMVGVQSQREIEHAVARAQAGGKLGDASVFPARMTLEIAGLGLRVEYDGEIRVR
jgi:hypothetical protein